MHVERMLSECSSIAHVVREDECEQGRPLEFRDSTANKKRPRLKYGLVKYLTISQFTALADKLQTSSQDRLKKLSNKTCSNRHLQYMQLR